MTALIKQEFKENEQHVYHRLIHVDGRTTGWATYTRFTYLDGMVGYTAYYSDKEGVVSAAVFCHMTGVN